MATNLGKPRKVIGGPTKQIIKTSKTSKYDHVRLSGQGDEELQKGELGKK